MRLRLNNSVISAEQQTLGRLKYLLLDRENLQMGGLVVQSKRWLLSTRETFVPAHLCFINPDGEIANPLYLEVSNRQFETLEPYWDYQSETSDEDVSPTWLHCNPEAFFVYHPSQTYLDTKRIRNCATELVQLGSSTQLLLTDGGRGKIREFYLGIERHNLSPRLLSLTASFGNGHNAIIPASWLNKIEDDKILLDMGRAELAERLTWPTRLASVLEKVK